MKLEPLTIADSALPSDFTDEPTESTPEEIQLEAEKWVNRCKLSASIFISLWIGWIVASQLLRNTLPSSWYMLNPQDVSRTGW
jgi:hypothetical protein